MPLEIFSPHSGRPVMVRDQDLGRAIRDEGGRVFYVVPRSDGEGHYGSLTRKGSERDENRYLNAEWKLAGDASVNDPTDASTPTTENIPATAASIAHDATGVRSPWRRWIILVVLITMVVFGVLIALREKPGAANELPNIESAETHSPTGTPADSSGLQPESSAIPGQDPTGNLNPPLDP